MDYPDGHRGVHFFKTVSPFDTTSFKAIPADLTEMKVGDYVLTCPDQSWLVNKTAFGRNQTHWGAPDVVAYLSPKAREYYRIDAYPITKINTASIYISTETDNIKIDYKGDPREFVKTKNLVFKYYMPDKEFMDMILSPTRPEDFVFDEDKWNEAQRLWNNIKDDAKDKPVDDIIVMLKKCL